MKNKFIYFQFVLALFIFLLPKFSYSQNTSFTGTYSISKDKFSPLLLIKQIRDSIYYEIWNFGGATPGSRIGNTYGKVKLNGNTVIDIVENQSSGNSDTLIIQFSPTSAKIKTKLGADEYVFSGFETTNLQPDGLYKKTSNVPPKFSFSESDFNGITADKSETEKTETIEKAVQPSTINLFGDAISLKVGDIIIINNPSIKPLSDVWRYRYVYTDFWPDMPERSGTLQGRFNLKTTIKQLKYWKDGKTLYALVGFTNNGKNYELTIDVKKAITNHEIDLVNQSIIDKFVLFKAYLKSIKSINDNVVVGYINNFEPAKGDLNEFEKRRIIQNAKTKLDSIAGSDLRTTDLKYLSKLQFQEYDFSSHSFKTKGIGNSINFDFDSNIDGSSNIINLQFNNVGEELNIPINEAEAEKIASSYFKNGERTVYCIYNFDLANTTSGTVKAGAARLFGLSNALVQKSTVTSISFFGDADYANKIAEYKFNKTTEPKNEKIADRHATFPGGEKAMNDYVRTKLLYPKEANEKNIQGTVFIKFFVDTDGSIVNPSALTHLGGGLEELGIRIVKGMPNWLPAIKDGKPIKEELNIPFKFSRE